MDIYINGKKKHLKAAQAIGKGGEADIYKLTPNTVLKLFKQPDHPDYQFSPPEQQAAQLRIQQHQQKLRQFPTHLPPFVIQPQDLATDRTGTQILGYTMPFIPQAEVLLRYSEKSFRQAGIGNPSIVDIFQKIHQSLQQIHQKQVIIGDFNDLNILIKDQTPYFIDTDSFQFGSFLCNVFTAKFVDPLLCDPTAFHLNLQQPYNTDSDWYAFNVMLMQCLLFVSPYGGVYQPQNKSHLIPQSARPLQRITIFHPEVKYPKPATPYQVLSDDLLHHFYQVFVQDQRGEFPRSLLDQQTWQTCPSCGIEHSRQTCPLCSQAPINPIPPVGLMTVRGQVIVQQIFHTSGLILTASLTAQTLQWLYHEKGAFKRENSITILEGELSPQLTFFLQNQTTFIAQQGQVITLKPHQPPESLAVDQWGNLPQFATQNQTRFWLNNGQLLRDGTLGPVYMGDVLTGQTRFWVGNCFGFGFYRAGNLSVAFVFDVQRPGINDQVQLHFGSGQLLAAHCILRDRLGWFFWTLQHQGQTEYHCAVIQSNGEILATHSSTTETWLSPQTGKCAVRHFLLVATDEGIQRIEIHNQKLQKTKTFPDTEPFLNSQSQLFPTPDGLYVVNPQTIQLLKLN